MTKKLFAIHGKAKGKNLFDHAPTAHVWANDEADAARQGELITRSNPIYNEHFGEGVKAEDVGQ